jgi:hypothetical protein
MGCAAAVGSGGKLGGASEELTEMEGGAKAVVGGVAALNEGRAAGGDPAPGCVMEDTSMAGGGRV